MERRLMGIKELSEYIRISPQTIYNRINRGDFPIPFRKIFGRIRFDKEDVDHFLNKLPIHCNLENGRSKPIKERIKLDSL